MKTNSYYITGISGSGKSEVRNELQKRGYLAFDGDENGITGWRERKTGKFVRQDDRKGGPDGSRVELYDLHMSRQRVEELVTASAGNIVFICGTASNRYDLWDMFDAVFCLSIDSETLVHRLRTRTNNEFGKDPRELEAVIGWHKPSERTDAEAGAIVINATRTVQEVTDEILSHVRDIQLHNCTRQRLSGETDSDRFVGCLSPGDTAEAANGDFREIVGS
jgi:broad-specificity NMP kinase